MKVVFIVRWYTPGFGYIPNSLSQEFKNQGIEVHILTSKYQSYWNHPNYKEIYEKYQGPNILNEGVFNDNGVYVHRLPSYRIKNTIIISNIYKTLKEIKPDVIQSFDIHELHTLKAALYSYLFKYKLFTANHIILISFRLLNKWKKLDFKKRWFVRIYYRFPAFFIKRVAKKCYAVTKDSRQIAIKLFGYPANKIEVSVLGVNTNLYHPIKEHELESRIRIRTKLNFEEDEIVCVFSGKITEEKSPLVLAQAVERLQKMGKRYKAIFIGAGELKAEIEKLPFVTTIDFVSSNELAEYYRACEIAVWPRSVTTSIQDAAACALPVIISDQVFAYQVFSPENIDYQRQPSIIAAKYETNNVESLVNVLASFEKKELRKHIGSQISQIVENHLSWKSIASNRIKDYQSL